VQSVQIDYAARTATAIFDPAVTSVEAIAAASTDAGYPAAIKR
jgi:mercuric ion binding protein